MRRVSRVHAHLTRVELVLNLITRDNDIAHRAAYIITHRWRTYTISRITCLGRVLVFGQNGVFFRRIFFAYFVVCPCHAYSTVLPKIQRSLDVQSFSARLRRITAIAPVFYLTLLFCVPSRKSCRDCWSASFWICSLRSVTRKERKSIISIRRSFAVFLNLFVRNFHVVLYSFYCFTRPTSIIGNELCHELIRDSLHFTSVHANSDCCSATCFRVKKKVLFFLKFISVNS